MICKRCPSVDPKQGCSLSVLWNPNCMLLDINDAVHWSKADWLTSEIEQGRTWQHSRWRMQKENNVKWKAQALAALDTFYCFKHLVLLQFSIWLCQLPMYCQHAGITEPIISPSFTVQEDQVHLHSSSSFHNQYRICLSMMSALLSIMDSCWFSPSLWISM